MRVKDIEARRAALVEAYGGAQPRHMPGTFAELYEDVLDAIAKSGVYPAAAQAKAALGRPLTNPTCALCGEPVPTPAHRFCGGACSQRWEAGERRKPVDPNDALRKW